MPTYSYSRWDGSQQVFDLDEDSIMDSLSEDILAHGDLNRALRGLFQRCMVGDDRRIDGLRDLMERLREQRQRQLERFRLESVMDDLKERLQDVIETERQGGSKGDLWTPASNWCRPEGRRNNSESPCGCWMSGPGEAARPSTTSPRA